MTAAFQETYTITFGDQAENHVGMQKIGQLADRGFASEDLDAAQRWAEARGCEYERIDLATYLPADLRHAFPDDAADAQVLVLRGAANHLHPEVCADRLFAEQRVLPKDAKARMYGRVVNKHARHNLCFADYAQEPRYELGEGRIVPFGDVPALARLRAELPAVLGPKAESLAAEGNYYFAPDKCGIGFHGDSERRKVVGLRLGATMQLCFAWFHRRQVADRDAGWVRILLRHGDMYIMTQKATGQDWKCSKAPTLRHAAGCAKYTTLPRPPAKKAAKAAEEEDRG